MFGHLKHSEDDIVNLLALRFFRQMIHNELIHQLVACLVSFIFCCVV